MKRKKKFNLFSDINLRKAADKAAATKPKAKPVEITAWQRYRHLQSVDARAAGIFWRANKQAIVDCI